MIMKIEKEKQQVEPEAQLLKEEELGKVSGGGGGLPGVFNPLEISSPVIHCQFCGVGFGNIEEKHTHEAACSKRS